MNEGLAHFVDHAVQKGQDYASIHQLLSSAGWKDREIAEAFCARQLDIPVPPRSGSSSARDTFFHLLTFTALYVWVIQLVVLLFNIIDLQLPEPGEQETGRLSVVRGSLAAVLVAFPLFGFLWRRMRREIRKEPEKAANSMCRWLTYLSLYIAAVTVLTDVITLIYYLLEGEQTLRFLLKVAVLFVIAGSAFLYLSSTLRWQRQPDREQ